VRERLVGSLRRVTFFVVPSAVAFVAIGGSIVALLYQTGRFSADDVRVVWIILAGSAIGLVAGTQGRLLASSFYALGDTRRPLYAALARIGVSAALSIAFVFPIRDALGYSATWAAFALAAASSLGAWIELLLLRHWLAARLGGVPVPVRLMLGTFAAAAIAGGAGLGAATLAGELGLRAWAAALVAIPVFGGVYLGATVVARVPEATAMVRRILRRR
jgi:putative peptidoglycan lipid II flippase